jgi:hypothetical protein
MWAMPTVRAAWGMAASILLLISHVDLISATAGGVNGVSSPVSLQLRGSSVPDSSLRLRGGGIPCLTGIFGGGNKASGGSAPKIIIAGAPASGKGTQCEFLVKTFGVRAARPARPDPREPRRLRRRAR